jgi:hypothetical protein
LLTGGDELQNQVLKFEKAPYASPISYVEGQTVAKNPVKKRKKLAEIE